MKIFVTGGSTIIGRHLIRLLIQRDHDVYALTRSEAHAAEFASLGAVPVMGEINDVESMREAMAECDALFHCAGWQQIGSDEWMVAESVNVGGTRQVLRLAGELGVRRVIYTSSAAVYGDTHGQLVDETHVQGGPFHSEYARTKWLAHYKVALPMIEEGNPISIAVPGVTYGPGDPGPIAALMRGFYQGKMTAVPGSDYTVSYVHVEDVALGLIRILEDGHIGESYNLAGPAIPLGEMVDFWAQVTGKPAPRLFIPARFFRPFAPILEMLRGFIPLPNYLSQEAVELINSSSMLRADKAKEQLGWRNRTLQEGMVETFRWIDETTPPKPVDDIERKRKIAAAALLAAAFVFNLWLLTRNRK